MHSFKKAKSCIGTHHVLLYRAISTCNTLQTALKCAAVGNASYVNLSCDGNAICKTCILQTVS